MCGYARDGCVVQYGELLFKDLQKQSYQHHTAQIQARNFCQSWITPQKRDEFRLIYVTREVIDSDVFSHISETNSFIQNRAYLCK
jgi:hypothetical protein